MKIELTGWLDHGQLWHIAIASTVILTTGLMMIRVFRSQSSATRYSIGMLTCVALAIMPAAVAFLPMWRIGLVEVASPKRVHWQAPATSTFFTEPLQNSRDVTSPQSMSKLAADVAPIMTSGKPFEETSLSPESQASWSFLNFAAWLYLAGLAYGVIRLLSDHASAWRLKRNSTEFVHNTFESDRSLAIPSHFRHRASIRVSDSITVPMVTGLTRPALLMPTAALEWSYDKLSSVIAHESAHIDCLRRQSTL